MTTVRDNGRFLQTRSGATSPYVPPRPQGPISIAIVGASGFVGLRTTEVLSGQSAWNVRPIVRSASSLAVLSRQQLDWRIADLLSVRHLHSALDGCAVCVHAAIGDAAQIVRMAESIYRACAMAGVKRLVWLSSAAVHGQNAAIGTDETSPLNDDQPLIYNNAKVRAEWALERLSRDGKVEVVRLRPAIVFGPRSRWISDTADALRAGSAAWINRGEGICNTVYIDNLVSAICLSALEPNATGHAFLVTDNEIVTWRDLLMPIAEHLGFSDAAFTNVPVPVIEPERGNPFAALTMSSVYAACSRRLPERAKRVVKGVITGWKAPAPVKSSWRMRPSSAPQISAEMALLQQCRWSLPSARARQVLGYNPHVTFNEGVRNSLQWLDFVQ